MSQWMIANEENQAHLQHYGTPGMKWGVRNYIDYNGTLTAAGRERYNKSNATFSYDGKTASAKKYTQSASLARRKQDIADIRTQLKKIGKDKSQKAERKRLREDLKRKVESYRRDSAVDKYHYNESKNAAQYEIEKERENLKDVNNYISYNKKMATSVERAAKFTELMGKYNKRSSAEIEAKKNSQANIISKHRNEASRVENQDIREATSDDNVSRYRAAMKNISSKARTVQKKATTVPDILTKSSNIDTEKENNLTNKSEAKTATKTKSQITLTPLQKYNINKNKKYYWGKK